mmetsp:Transcript_56855/g.166454  ORF Transcript_56855/g.166454 Transcript_56855/m.166454 type:complete len:260 (+) Transcript_56855:2802-3581(+)
MLLNPERDSAPTLQWLPDSCRRPAPVPPGRRRPPCSCQAVVLQLSRGAQKHSRRAAAVHADVQDAGHLERKHARLRLGSHDAHAGSVSDVQEVVASMELKHRLRKLHHETFWRCELRRSGETNALACLSQLPEHEQAGAAAGGFAGRARRLHGGGGHEVAAHRQPLEPRHRPASVRGRLQLSLWSALDRGPDSHARVCVEQCRRSAPRAQLRRQDGRGGLHERAEARPVRDVPEDHGVRAVRQRPALRGGGRVHAGVVA